MLVKCRCGKSEMSFRKLKVEDLLIGWDGDCCGNLEKVVKTTNVEPDLVEAPKRKRGRPKKVKK